MPSNRRWLSFSLRGLLLAFVLFGIYFGLLAHAARQQEQAVNAIQKMGGHVTYAHELSSAGVNLSNPSTPGPQWLRNILGEHFFIRLAKISFEKATDQDLASLQNLKLDTVEHLLLVDSPITDEGIKSLDSKTFPNLRRLRLDDTRISDAGLANLKELTKLENLYLSNTAIGNAGIHDLSSLKNLKFLDLTNTKVDAAGRAELQKSLPGLKIASP